LTPQLDGEADAVAEVVLDIVTSSMVVVCDVTDELSVEEELLVTG
jgi:hypothetical protein